ncbi:hypothetical protein [Nakamurella aerolata]|uniref:Regulatory protein n=1 Tax=Nakamurella aerolata TaxID=1656892 RepID=A0A849A8W5_9ACTN|nr:hypothetical protein [Nakamurella aerolata]NNG34920.1 hypothetical protein [Nakamurella aerolata]
MRMRLRTEGTKYVVVVAPSAKLDQSGNQRVDKSGAMLWQLTVVPIGDEFMREALTIVVDAEPKVSAGSFVEVHDLVATTWEIEGRSGVSFRAQRVAPVSASGSGPAKAPAA